MEKWKSPLTELRFPILGLNRRAGFDEQSKLTTPFCINVRPFDVAPTTTVASPGELGYETRQRGGSRPGLLKSFSEQLGTTGGSPIQFIDYASVQIGGNTSNVLIAIADGILYSNWANVAHMAAVSGGNIFNASALIFQGCQIGNLYYIADYRQTTIYSQVGTIATATTLTDPALAGYVPNIGQDVIWISPTDPAQENIFPITGYNSGTHTVTFTNSTGNTLSLQSGVTWQIGVMPKVYDPAHNTVDKFMPTPIPATNYDLGRVSVASGIVTLHAGATGASWAGIPAVTAANQLTLTIPNNSGIGTQSYLVQSVDSTTQLTLLDKTTDADTPTTPANTTVTYTLTWVGSYFGVPPLGCTLCCNYRGRLVLAGGFWAYLWYMSRQTVPGDWDYGFDPNDPGRAVAGSNSNTGGPQEPLTALMPHADQYLVFATGRGMWKMTQDPAYSGQISSLSRQIGCVASESWCAMPDSSIMFLSRDGLYLMPPNAEGFPQTVSRPLMPQELVDVDAVNNYVTMIYDVQAQGIHLSITPKNLAAATVTVTNIGPTTSPATAANDYTPTGSLYNGLPIYFSATVGMYLSLGTVWAGGTNWIICADPPSGGSPLSSYFWYGPLSINGAIGHYKPGNNSETGIANVSVFPNGTHFFFDWVAKGFWPVALFSTQQPTAVIRYGPAGATANVLLGGYDGYLRNYSNAAADDDGIVLTTCITYGPFRPGSPGYYGQLNQIAAELEAQIDNVQWVIGAGDTSQQALNEVIGIVNLGNTPRWSGLWTTGRNNRDYPRAVGGAICIGIVGVSGLAIEGPWAIEGLRCEFKRKGPMR